ncbi:sortase family protein, LPXTG-site transpeptidase [Actinobacteria bacterium IMCC26207]|nr:sortase family protein, LPXTG-site transpeptidase [Actinobacteria bacterium IMCC26207]
MFGKILGVIGKALIVAGLLVLGFVGYQLWGTAFSQSNAQAELTRTLANESDVKTTAGPVVIQQLADELASVNAATAPATAPPPEGEPVGVITIAKIGLQRVIVEGVAKPDLKKGPGHYPGTPLPGQAGNSAIAGHRTTYGAPFNRIDELVVGDEIQVATPQGEFTYVVIPAPGQPTQAWYTVSPAQVEVLANMGDNRITLTACHPKYSAKQRIIVHGVLKTPPAAAAVVVAPPSETAAPATASAQFDEGQAGDSKALQTALFFGAAAAAVALLAWILGKFVRRWPIYVLATPVILVLIWYAYVYTDRYLPSL